MNCKTLSSKHNSKSSALWQPGNIAFSRLYSGLDWLNAKLENKNKNK
jgi:hypothetical protein